MASRRRLRRRTPSAAARERFRREWLDREYMHSTLVERYARGAVVRLTAELERDVLEPVIRATRAGLRGVPRGTDAYLARKARFLLREVETAVRRGSESARRQLAAEAMTLARVEVGWLARTVRSVLGIDWSAPAPSLVRAALLERPVNGVPFREMFSEWFPGRTLAVAQARIRSGLVAGETNEQIIRGLRGLPSRSFQDAALAAPRRAMQTVARTLTTHTSTVARELSFAENRDVVPRVRWLATLDVRTCPVCGALDLRTWARDEPHPNPPRHPNCRCTLMPDIAAGEPIGRRASEDGPVEGDTSYADWARNLSDERMRLAFGARRADLIQSGDLNVRQLVDDGLSRTLTLAELRELDRI